MAKGTSGFISFMDGLSTLGKIIFCIPILHFAWGIYRIAKGVNKSNTFLIIVGILWIIPGAFICWLVDLITIILNGKPTVFVE